MPFPVRSLVLSLTVAATMGAGASVPAVAEPGAPSPRAAGAVRPTGIEQLRSRLAAHVEGLEQWLSDEQDRIWAGDLHDDQKYTLAMTIRYELQGLHALGGSISEATEVEQLRGYRSDLRRFYPHFYAVAVDYLRTVNRLAARIAANDALRPTLREGYAACAGAVNDAARAALGSPAVEDRGGRAYAAELRSARAGLSVVKDQLRIVDRVVAEEHRFVRLQNRVLARAQAKQVRLSQIRAEVVGSSLSDDQKIALGSAASHSALELSDLFSAASATTTLDELAPLVPVLDAFYPQAYDAALAALEQAPGLQARIAQNDADLAAISDRDVSAGVAANAAAARAVASALDRANEVGDGPTRAGARAVRVQLSLAHEKLRLVRRVLAGE